ncbi:FAD-binding oxidoreductase [Aquimarina sp. MMG016]|uniref:NAD(P)/FAD-dependent oxidoreductase n=1 Tax=Aquimarina sp. MMG016 TaxID=2822690 RepID=UPI001B3A319C|nr:FAD-binding oxidoreductase [Aquimarina sp. MMG016]MBQ4820779.1 FAD-binding oxidoreductase [Aquimarina sp. MMG016]
MVDYIIVGFGLAGLSFAEQLENNSNSYIVIEDNSQKSSRVAGGLCNPVILKRFTAAWNASDQLKTAVTFYKNIEDKLGESFVVDLPIFRRFNSIEEQNTWFEACDKPVLAEFLSSELVKNENSSLDVPYYYGQVHKTRRIDIKKMLSIYVDYLKEGKRYIEESFEYDRLTIKEDSVEYKGVKAKNIIFCEGFGVKKNPFFNYLPLVGNKGEYLIIKSTELQLKEAVKSSIFIIPLGENLYKVGATYNNQDKSSDTTRVAKEELQEKLAKFLKADYKIVDQVAGIRPTVKDRRPLIGTHPEQEKIHILNGFGSRGIMIGPSVAKMLYDYIEKGIDMDPEIDIKRFDGLR